MAGRPRSGARREVKELNDVGFVVIPGPAALLRLHLPPQHNARTRVKVAAYPQVIARVERLTHIDRTNMRRSVLAIGL